MNELRRERPHARLYALVDLSIISPQLLSALDAFFLERQCLLEERYAGGGGSGVEGVDMWLMDLSLASNEAIAKLVQLCAELPVLAFILTASPSEKLRRHLSQQLRARDDQSNLCILRWANTRFLSTMYGCFSEQQRRRLMDGIDAWSFLGRNGEPQVIHASPPNEGSVGQQLFPYVLSTAQTLALRTAAIPEAILTLIARRPHLYATLAGMPSLQHPLKSDSCQWPKHDFTHTAKLVRTAAQNLDGRPCGAVPLEPSAGE
ncbi:DUF4123 domain-containing protein [Pseudomonas aeruginosa]